MLRPVRFRFCSAGSPVYDGFVDDAARPSRAGVTRAGSYGFVDVWVTPATRDAAARRLRTTAVGVDDAESAADMAATSAEECLVLGPNGDEQVRDLVFLGPWAAYEVDGPRRR